MSQDRDKALPGACYSKVKKLLRLDGNASLTIFPTHCLAGRHGGREVQRTTLLVVRTGTRDLLARRGIDCLTVTGAGTGSFEFEAASGVFTESQCGSYIFMDADYGRNRDRAGSPFTTFEPSLYVWATVMSRPTEDRAIVDDGLKALPFDSGCLLSGDAPAATYERASDEHGKLGISGATNRLHIGDKIRLIPGHCDPTVNLYDWYVCVRNNRVEQLWPITARGAVY